MFERSLRRQLKQLDLGVDKPPVNDEQWKNLLKAINSAYESNKNTRYVLERTLEISDKEMTQLHCDLKEETEQRIKVLKESESKSRFMENMSHELRTPLHGILGSLEIVKDNTNLGAKQKTFINTALMSGENLLDIVNNILNFSKINANQLELEKITFDIRALFNSFHYIIKTMADEKSLVLSSDIADNIPARIKGDPAKVRQIIMNLASNAVKFTRKGLINFNVKLLEKDTVNALLRIEMTDTGIGIPAEKMDDIFKAFEQIDTSTTREYEGIGLGLTITKELVHLMGGVIQLESVEGKGSHFWADIPFETVNTDANGDVSSSSALSGIRALIIEKDKNSASIFDHYFSKWNIQYTLVDSSREAIDMLYHSRKQFTLFDVVFMDYFMPGMDSLELTEILNTHPDFQIIPKVILSSYDLEKEEREIANIKICLTKPIRETLLKGVLFESLKINQQQTDQTEQADDPCQLLDALSKEGLTLSNLSDEHFSEEKTTDILLAEDNPVNALIATTMIEQIGLSVKHVKDGQQALEEVQKNSYKLILMDMHMPTMDGYDSTKYIRRWEQENQKEPMPIIALTANALAGDRDKCLVAGMDDYLPKPIKQDILQEVVTKWLAVCDIALHAPAL
jgi:signal transduction histidine kinase/DNA-binding response OmpR family regulator